MGDWLLITLLFKKSSSKNLALTLSLASKGFWLSVFCLSVPLSISCLFMLDKHKEILYLSFYLEYKVFWQKLYANVSFLMWALTPYYHWLNAFCWILETSYSWQIEREIKQPNQTPKRVDGREKQLDITKGVFWIKFKLFSLWNPVTRIMLMGRWNTFFSGSILALRNYTCTAIACNLNKLQLVLVEQFE